MIAFKQLTIKQEELQEELLSRHCDALIAQMNPKADKGKKPKERND